MEDSNSLFLPQILEILSKKPDLCDTYDNLYDEIEAALSSQNRKGEFGNLKKAIKKALEIGENLGIITLTNDSVRVPFDFHTKARNSRARMTKDDGDKPNKKRPSAKDSEYFVEQPPRRKRVLPNLLPHGPSGRRISSRRRSAKSDSSRSRSARSRSSKRGSSTSRLARSRSAKRGRSSRSRSSKRRSTTPVGRPRRR